MTVSSFDGEISVSVSPDYITKSRDAVMGVRSDIPIGYYKIAILAVPSVDGKRPVSVSHD